MVIMGRGMMLNIMMLNIMLLPQLAASPILNPSD
jgi:hypothetical protein